MLSNLFWILVIGLHIAGVHFCGKKFLAAVPGILIPLTLGVVTNILLWDAANGSYQDSDTIIFGAPRVPGSAEAWFEPASTACVLGLTVLALVIVTFAIWPKNRPVFRLTKRTAT
jgi:hypothetical protein